MRPKADALGDRMKRYEAVTQTNLPRRTYTILRVDGKSFHSWTRGLRRPYDTDLMELMDVAACQLCQQISGARFAFVQSDEINLLAVDFLDIKTEPWFDGNVQKWASVGASIATMAFNLALSIQKAAECDPGRLIDDKLPNAMFDARVFIIPDLIDVENYFVWRQKDATRNSVTMLAQHYASHKQLQGKDQSARQEIIHKAGDNWAKHPADFRHGRVVRRSDVGDWGRDIGKQPSPECYAVPNWHVDHETPIFTRKREYLRGLIPLVWENDLIVRKAVAGE
jgi:tRNA(His) 5'-end guanylyltransferase